MMYKEFTIYAYPDRDKKYNLNKQYYVGNAKCSKIIMNAIIY